MEPPHSLMPRRARWTSSLWTRPSFSTCPIPGAHDWTGTRPLPPSFNQGSFLSVYGCCVVYIERTRDVNLNTPKDISIHFCDVWHSHTKQWCSASLIWRFELLSEFDSCVTLESAWQSRVLKVMEANQCLRWRKAKLSSHWLALI